MRAIPGFESVAISGEFPLAGGNGATLYARADRPVPPIPERANAPSHDIMPGYIRTWGIPLIAGRDFDEHDIAGHPNVVLISQAGARKVFGDENPIGRSLLVTSNAVPCEIVGILGDVRSGKVSQPNEMEFYRPWAQENFTFMSMAVRSQMDTQSVTHQVQRALTQIDPTIALAQPQSMEEVVRLALGEARLMMYLLGIFAGVALLLATVGIYGAVAYTVEQRTGEIGVRMALGAQTLDVLRLIVSQGMKPVFFGLVIGLGAALVLGRLIASQLYQVSTHSPILLTATALILGIAALLACLFPARRASRVNPLIALRAE